METRRAVAVILVVVLLAGAAALGLAAIADYSAPIEGEVPVTTNETPTITLAGETDVNLVDMWEGDQLNITTAEGNMTVSGDTGASARVHVTDIEGTQTQVTEIDAGSDWLEFDPADKNRVDVRGDVETLAFEDIAADDGSSDIQISGSEDGTAELRLHGLAADESYALYDSSRDEVLGQLETDGSGTGTGTVAMPDGAQSLEVRTAGDFATPTLANPTPTGDLSERPDELAVDVDADAWPAEVEFEFEGETVETIEVDESGTVATNITVEEAREYNWSATVTDELGETDSVSETFDTSTIPGPEISNAEPEGAVTEIPDELSADISAVAWPTEVEFTVDGDVVHTETISENATVTADISGEVTDLGAYDWSVSATDAVNQTTTYETSFETPDELVLREEHDPEMVIDNSTVTMRFYTVDGTLAIERETEDGTVDMTGLPDSEFVAFMESPDHYDRSVYIDSIFEQEDLFLLNETAFPRAENDAVQSRFIYEDQTGGFPSPDTTIEIQRALDLNGDGESEYRTIAGDYWGASNEYATILEHGARYRIVLTNQETGAENIAGTHIPTEDLSQTLRISGLVEEASNATGIVGLAELTDDNQIDLAYNDPTNETDSLRVIVESRGGGETIYDETIDGPLGLYTEQIALNESEAEQDWVVRFESDEHQSAIPVGSGAVGTPVDVPGWIMSLLMCMAVTFVGALYGPRTAIMGAWAMVFVAAGAAMFGWAFGGASVVIAALVAVGATLMSRAMP